MSSRTDTAGHIKVFDYPVMDHGGESALARCKHFVPSENLVVGDTRVQDGDEGRFGSSQHKINSTEIKPKTTPGSHRRVSLLLFPLSQGFTVNY